MISPRLTLSAFGLILGLAVLGCNRKAAAPIKEETPGLAKSAKVDSATAQRTALAKVPDGKVLQEELEKEGGKLIYSFDIKSGTKPGVEEVQVDALDGSVVSVKHESAANESAEAKKEGATHP